MKVGVKMFRNTKEIIRKLIILQVLVAILCLSACGNDETDTSVSSETVSTNIETTSVVNDESTTAESIDETTSEEITSEIESDASEEITSEISGDDTTVVEETAAESDTTEETSIEEETTDESTTKKQETTANKETTTKKQNTTANKETTTKKQQNTTKQTTTKKPEPTTEEETTTNIEDIPDGVVWWYDSNIYADHPEKSELENKFWSMYGWTTFSKAKNDAMTRAVVELAYEIMNTYDTEFEREKALYDAICERVEYDYEDY